VCLGDKLVHNQPKGGANERGGKKKEDLFQVVGYCMGEEKRFLLPGGQGGGVLQNSPRAAYIGEEEGFIF